MKHLKIIFILIPVIMLTVRCEKPEVTGGVSKITYFPEFTMEGEAYEVVETGSNYVDPGVTATEGGEEIPVETSGSVDTSEPSVYVIDYEATNSDGYGGSVQRVVRVVTHGADNTNIAGLYDGIRDNRGAGGVVTITKIAPGVFEVDDFLGGYYWQNLGYGALYSANGIFTENADGTFTASQGYIPGWGSEVQANNLIYDSVAKTFKHGALLVAFDFGFDVTLTLKE